jgi:hypothetical protein
MTRQLWHEGRPRHARLRVHFETDQFAGSTCCVVEAEIRSRDPAATQRLMRS